MLVSEINLWENNGIFVQIVAILFFALVFRFVFKILLKRLESHFEKTYHIWKLSFVRALYQPLMYSVWVVAAILIIDLMLYRYLGYYPLHPELILKIAAVLTFGWFLLRWNVEIIRGIKQTKRIDLNPGKLDLLSKLGTIAALLITVFLLMDVTGRNLETLIAFGGIGGIALAFASQQFISNLFGGINVYMTQPFTVGERILLPSQNIEGRVEEIGWYTTCIRHPDRGPIYIPNSIFNQSIVITPSRLIHPRLYFKIKLKITQSTALENAVKQVKELLEDHPSINHQKKSSVFLTKLDGPFVEMEISADISRKEETDASTVRQEILLKIISILEDLSIKLE